MEHLDFRSDRETVAVRADVRRASLVLSLTELQELTGLKRACAIEQWLVRHGWVHEPAIRPGEYPRVARAYYYWRLVDPSAAPSREAARPLGPNLDFMLKGGAARSAKSM